MLIVTENYEDNQSMQKLITTSTAFYGAGNSLSRRSFVVKSGPYSGRRVIIYPGNSSTLELRYADPPFNEWSAPVPVASDAADFPCSGWIDDDGNLYCVYSQQTTLNLIFRKLSFDLGEWSVGSAVAIFDGGGCYFPAIARDSLQRLHVTYTWFDSGSGNYRIRYKRSTTDGAVWGAGPSDIGTDLSTGSASAYSQLLYSAPNLYCVYTDASTKLNLRTLIDGGLLWNSEELVHGGILLSDRFSAAISEGGGLLGIAFESTGRLYYVEYDGQTWSGESDLAIGPVVAPLLQFFGSDPVVLYGMTVGNGQTAIVYRRKQGAGFLPQVEVGGDVAPFLDVVLYDDDATTKYVSRKEEAASSSSADVSHFTSGALVAGPNDALYLGAEQPFASASVTLSTAGIGGEVVWEYFNGTNWIEITPDSGIYHLNQLTQLVRIWEDSASAPSDWQTLQINSTTAYWLRARVTATFGTPPVGSQLTPLTDIKYLSA